MNDLKLLTAFEKKLNINKSMDFISFDINMETIYATDHDRIYGIDMNNIDVIKCY